MSKLREIEGAPQHRDRFVIDAQRHRERMAVFAAMRECETSRVIESRRRSVDDFSDKSQRLQRARPDLLQEQECPEVTQGAFVGIGATGTGSIGAVSVGIAEALIETALGLFVAIPAVWFYNYLSNRLEYFNVEMDNSSSELVDYFIKKTAAA